MNDETMKLTDFDYLTGDHHLQMVKAALPYVGISQQKFLSILVKCQELQKTLSLFNNEEENASIGICSLDESASRSPFDMLEAIKPYGNTQEQDFIDLICNFLQGARIGSQYQQMQMQAQSADSQSNTGDAGGTPRRPSLEQLKAFLSPEQQSRLDTITMLLQAMQQLT